MPASTSQITSSSDHHQGFRLSAQQRRLWSDDPRALRIGQATVFVDGALDVDRLHRAIDKVAGRHEILRTTFHQPQALSLPLQVVGDLGGVAWRHVLLESSAEDVLRARCREDRDPPFALDAGPLLRASLLSFSKLRHLLVLTLPAVCGDAVTLRHLADEIRRGYDRMASLETDGEAISYIQFSEWQRSLQGEDEAPDGREHWRRQDEVDALVLPLQRPRDESTAFESSSGDAIPCHSIPCRLPISSDQSARIAAHEREDLFVFSCWVLLLWRLTGSARPRVGVVFDGRTFDELDATMGPISRLLPVSCPVQEEMRFTDLVARLEDAIDEALDWQDYCDWSEAIGGDFQETAVFEFMAWDSAKMADGTQFHLRGIESDSGAFDIKLSCVRAGEALIANLHFDPRVVPPEYAARLAEQLRTVIDGALERPETAIGQFEILSERARHFLLVECNETRADFPDTACLHHLFAEQVSRTPHRVAVTCGEHRLTFDELDRHANRLAHHLQDLGVGPEARVGLCVHRSVDLMIGLFGVLKAGAAYVPLEPSYPAERLVFMLSDAKVSVLLTETGLRDRLPTAGRCVLCLDETVEGGAERSEHAPRSGVTAANLAYVLYTSGSTGVPKGTLVSHRSLVNYLSWCTRAYDVESGSGAVVHSPIAFDATLTGLFAPLLVGRQVVLLPEAEGVDALSSALRKGDFSLVKLTPAHLALLNAGAVADAGDGGTRRLVLGGDALAAEHVAVWQKRAPETRLINEYGPTETVVGCCTHEVTAKTPEIPIVPIGRPIANTRLYTVNPRLEPVPIGVPGELLIGGAGLARGYHGRPALTAERFIPDAYSGVPGERLYRTGDRVLYREDGSLSFLGRLDHQLKIRSFRIEPGEIEAVLEQHPEVIQSAVIAYSAPSGEKSLAAYIAASAARVAEPSAFAEALREFMQRKVPSHMVPSVFVVQGALPLTANGKLDRGAVPPPETKPVDHGEEYTAPRTRVEEVLAGIWADLLGRERIGIHDDFFRAGGDSILSMQVVARAAQAGLRLVTRQLFERPTIAELATVVTADSERIAEQGEVLGEAPLTPIQHWFFEQPRPRPSHFNQAVFFEISAGLDFDRLQQALYQVVAHHDALRLRFERHAAGWEQTHAAADGAAVLCEIDLTQCGSETRRPAMEASAASVQASLDLTQGPLLRGVLYRLGAGENDRLLLVIHHLIIDGVSWRIVLEDLLTLYQALESGAVRHLPLKTTAFRDWARRLEGHARGEDLVEEMNYWLGSMAGSAQSLPVDGLAPHSANTAATLDRVRVSLDRKRTSVLLHEVSGVQGTRIDEFLLTALVLGGEPFTGSRSLLVDIERHGREDLFDLDISRTVGWFTALFPVYLDLAGSVGPGEALRTVKETLRQVPKRGIGYGILRYLSPDPHLRSALKALPQAEICFNHLGQVDGVVVEPLLGFAREDFGPEDAPEAHRTYLLEVISQVVEGCLRVDFLYSRALHHRATIERLADGFVRSLEALMEHSLSPEALVPTPVDFPEAGLSQEELEELVVEMESS